MEQKITILNKRGKKLVGLLHEAGSKELVILCHGFGTTKELKAIANLATCFEKEGISSFHFDFSGNGESEGVFGFANYSSEVEDLRAVVEHFSKENRPTFAIIGHSKGAGCVVFYASKYPDISAVVNLSGRYYLKRGMERRLGTNFLEKLKKDGYIDFKIRPGERDYQVTEECLKERLNTSMDDVCNLIDKDCRVLTVHGTDDEAIPVEDAYEFAKILPNHQLQIIEGADHYYNSHQEELAAAVLPFVKECLQRIQDVAK